MSWPGPIIFVTRNALPIAERFSIRDKNCGHFTGIKVIRWSKIASTHQFRFERKTQNLIQRLTARGTRILDGTSNERRRFDNAPNCELITTTKA
jgi:hypothetical protein